MTAVSSVRAAFAIAFVLMSIGCAPVVKRDLSNLPAGRVGFDDLCGLQTYHDSIATKLEMPPSVVSSSEIGKLRAGNPLGGRSRFAFQTEFQLRTLRRVFDENWRRLPEALANATRIDVEVQWSTKSGLRRVVTNQRAQFFIGKRQFELPYHVCLSELLFGEALYRRRREVLGLEALGLEPLTEPPLPASPPSPPSPPRAAPLKEPSIDAGTADAR
jgi:hypothetical protein